jgi:hypothetical protein
MKMPEKQKTEPAFLEYFDKNGVVYSRIPLEKKPKILRRTTDDFV